MTPARAAGVGVRLALPDAEPYEERLHGFRIRVRAATIRGAGGQWWQGEALRRGFGRHDKSRAMLLCYDGADVRCGFAGALRFAREAVERMAREAGWV